MKHVQVYRAQKDKPDSHAQQSKVDKKFASCQKQEKISSFIRIAWSIKQKIYWLLRISKRLKNNETKTFYVP